jgi:hypothetical protein
MAAYCQGMISWTQVSPQEDEAFAELSLRLNAPVVDAVKVRPSAPKDMPSAGQSRPR